VASFTSQKAAKGKGGPVDVGIKKSVKIGLRLTGEQRKSPRAATTAISLWGILNDTSKPIEVLGSRREGNRNVMGGDLRHERSGRGRIGTAKYKISYLILI